MSNQDLRYILNNVCGNRNSLLVPAHFAKALGNDRDAALFLSQCLYWSGIVAEKGREWFYKTDAEWMSELCMSAHDIKRCKGTLKKNGLLITKIKKANGNPTTHYQVSTDALIQWFCQISPVPSGEIQQNVLVNFTETVTDTTTDNTNIKEDAPLIKNIVTSSQKQKTLKPASTKVIKETIQKQTTAGIAEVAGVAEEVIGFLNSATGSSFNASMCIKEIGICLNNGLSVDDLKRIINNVKHWKDDDRNRLFLRPTHIFGKKAAELAALPQKASGGFSGGSGSNKEFYYLVNPDENPSAILVNEDEIPVGTRVWDKNGGKLFL